MGDLLLGTTWLRRSYWERARYVLPLFVHCFDVYCSCEVSWMRHFLFPPCYYCYYPFIVVFLSQALLAIPPQKSFCKCRSAPALLPCQNDRRNVTINLLCEQTIVDGSFFSLAVFDLRMFSILYYRAPSNSTISSYLKLSLPNPIPTLASTQHQNYLVLPLTSSRA